MHNRKRLFALGFVCLTLQACGGGGDAPPPAQVPAPAPVPAPPSNAARAAAAVQTADTNPACRVAVLPEGFYWEIGDANGLLVSGTVAGNNTPSASQVIAVASASKWIYAAYVLEKQGALRETDVPFLNFTSGHVYPGSSPGKEAVCGPSETVGACAADVAVQAGAVGKFYYSAGHFQYHAANAMGLADMGAAALSKEVGAQIGAPGLTYLQTNLAGGLNTSTETYTGFLRKMLRREYTISSHLGSRKVCGSAACAAGAVLSPAPETEAWNYAIGHWVEDDPVVGDHAFSSAGSLGFYPWIDSSQTWYGVLARRAESSSGQQGVKSLNCGRLIRQAWVTGVVVTATTPTPLR